MSFFPKRYFYDKTILILLSIGLFLCVVTICNILFQILSGQSGSDFFVQYRSTAGIGAFATGGVIDMLYFVAFCAITSGFGFALSVRTYTIKRELSFTILAFTILLLLVAAIVSNALLALR